MDNCVVDRPSPEREHYEKFDAIAHRFGVLALAGQLPCGLSALRKLYAEDNLLNNIPLRIWDNIANRVRYWPVTPGPALSLSLGEVVCLLKHVAIYYALKEMPPCK